MIHRTHLLIITGVMLTLGLLFGPTLFLPALKSLFPSLAGRWSAFTAQKTATATVHFTIAFCLLAGALPLSALVTGKFARRGKYSHALLKSLLIGALAFGGALFYQHQSIASLARLGAKMPGLFGPEGPPVSITANPLTKTVWFAGVCLLVFGPVDLLIARMQKQWRKPPATSQS